MHITLTDTDLATPTLVPLQVQVQDSVQTIVLQATTSTDQRAGQFTGSMLVYSEALKEPLLQAHAQVKWGRDVLFTYEDSLPEESVTARVRMPAPDFVDPTPLEGQVLRTAESCPLLQLIKAHDPSGFHVEIVATRFWSMHDWHGVAVHESYLREQPCGLTEGGAWECKHQGTYEFPSGHGLMPGASLENVTSILEVQQEARGLCPSHMALSSSCGAMRHGIQTAVLSWTATSQDKGRVWTQCFISRQVDGAVVGPERCFRIQSERCRRCALEGESLYSIASELGTEWGLLFSINIDLLHFAVLPSGLRINTGLLYRTVKGDTVESVGVRFGIMLEHIFRANPQARSLPLLPGDDVCVAPEIAPMDACPPQAKSSTWEPIEEQYVPPDYWDNPFNWEDIEYSTDPRGIPVKVSNPLYPQRPAVPPVT